MKKMLLLLVCLTTFAWLHAEDVTVTFDMSKPTTLVNGDGGQLGSPTSGNGLFYKKFGKDNVWVTVDFNGLTKDDQKLRFYNGTSGIVFRCSKNGGKAGQKFTISAPGNITKIEFDNSSKLTMSANPEGLKSKIWSGDAESVTFTTSGEVNIVTMAVTYTKVDENKVATPTFSHEAGNVIERTEVSIACATEGATIHYTTDGTDPSASSTEYTAPIAIDKAMTIKAIAVKEGMQDSGIAEAAYKLIVATPAFDPAAGEVKKGTPVTITCDTKGATLKYQVNGGDIQVGESPVTVVINEATTIEVVASKDGYVDSKATAKYTIIGEVETAPQAFFDFTKPADLKLTAKKDTPISDVPITVNGVTVTFSKGTDTDAKVWNNNGFHIRVYQGATITVSAGEGQSIESIQFKGATLFRILYNGTAIAKSGETTANWWSPTLTQRAAASNEVVFTIKDTGKDAGRADIKSINVNDPVVTGVEDVTVDENAPVEYYNLQGVRVANPENGIYIRRQGSKVSKVLVR